MLLSRSAHANQGGLPCGFSAFSPACFITRRSFCGSSRSALNLSPRRRGRLDTGSSCSICRSRPTAPISACSNSWRPDVVGFSCNYLPHVPEIVDLAKATKSRFPQIFIFVGGHSASFIAASIIEHGAGAIDCVLKGEGEAGMPLLLAAIEAGHDPVRCRAPSPRMERGRRRLCPLLDDLTPARDLLRHRRKYFLGTLDPCATIEFSRGCPWDCSFCSAWTFYGRSFRLISPERAVEDLRRPRAGGLHRR